MAVYVLGAQSGLASERPGPSLRLPMMLLLAFLAIFTALGVSPVSREDWLLENALVVVGLAILVSTARRFRLSDTSYVLLFAFLVLHEIGAHYTYSLVPYDTWLASKQGFTVSDLLGLKRNAFDRAIHFAFGLLLMFPASELTARVAPAGTAWRHLPALALILSASMVYELIEFAAALVFGGELGAAYLGTQGDVWDAQKDMACAVAGVLLAIAVMHSVPASKSSMEQES
jgi:putative membrane protein